MAWLEAPDFPCTPAAPELLRLDAGWAGGAGLPLSRGASGPRRASAAIVPRTVAAEQGKTTRVHETWEREHCERGDGGWKDGTWQAQLVRSNIASLSAIYQAT